MQVSRAVACRPRWRARRAHHSECSLHDARLQVRLAPGGLAPGRLRESASAVERRRARRSRRSRWPCAHGAGRSPPVQVALVQVAFVHVALGPGRLRPRGLVQVAASGPCRPAASASSTIGVLARRPGWRRRPGCAASAFGDVRARLTVRGPAAVGVSSALTWSGLRSGRACRSRAAAPATTGAAIEVPPMREVLAARRCRSGTAPRTRTPAASGATMCAPGARTSGLAEAVLRDAAAREGRERVVGGGGGAGLVGRADGDHERVVARRVLRRRRPRHRGCPRRRRRRCRRATRTRRRRRAGRQVGARRVRGDREVDDVDVELVLVVDDELQRVDDVEDGRVAVRRRRS